MLEYPKMLYIVVNNEAEEKAAAVKGYQSKPYDVPKAPAKPLPSLSDPHVVTATQPDWFNQLKKR
jgi:hypothetical protein